MSESCEETAWYVVVVDGEARHTGQDLKDALDECYEVTMHNFFEGVRKRLPVKVDSSLQRKLGVSLFRATERVELPLQEWFDMAYKMQLTGDAEQERRDFQRYVELRERFEERYQRGERPIRGRK